MTGGYLRYARVDGTIPKLTRKHDLDAGLDLHAARTVVVWPFSMAKVPTGILVDIPPGTVLLVWPKSRTNHLIGAGVIDAGYQGEVLVKVANYRPWPILIRKGDPLAQLLHQAIQLGEPQEVPRPLIHVAKTARGASGGIHG